jgi:Protein of unknown function (DUF721).
MSEPSDKSAESGEGKASSRFGGPLPSEDQVARVLAGSRKGRAQMASISNVLSEVVKRYGLDKSLKMHALTSYWPHAVGEPFASITRPLFIDYEGNLVVSVKDASVAQELSFKKPQLMKSLRPLANSVGLKLTGLRFDLKNYTRIANLDQEAQQRQAQKSQNEYVDQLRKEEPEDAELNAIELPEDDALELAAMRDSLLNQEGFASGPRILALYERELRLRYWRQSKGYPRCTRCQTPQPRLHGTSELCAGCYVETLVGDDS